MKKPRDAKGKYIRVYVDLLNSPAWRCLKSGSKALFVDLRAKLNGSNNGNISAALSDMKRLGWTSSGPLSRGLYELRSLGFIEVTREGGLRQGSRVPTLYRFTDLETYEHQKLGVLAMPETNGYRKFKSMREAEQARNVGVARLKEKGREKQKAINLPVSNENPVGADSTPEGEISDAESEQGDCIPVSNENWAIGGPKVPEAA